MSSTSHEIKATVLWLLFAFFLTFAGFWQAKVAVASDAAAKHRELPAPAKTKHAIRPPPAVFTGDVAQDYVARCEKGMTDQEIRWILEDFQNAGLAEKHPWDDPFNDPPNSSHSPAELESFLAYTRAQTRWYSDILRDGFRLSPEQSAELSRNLAKQLEKSQATFLGLVKNGFPKASPFGMSGEWTQHWAPWTGLYLHLPECHPWNLCSLTPSQEKICWRLAYETLDRGDHSPSGSFSFDASLPVINDRDYYFQNEGHLFPILKNQKLSQLRRPEPFAEPDQQRIQEKNFHSNLLDNIRHLHPAQLKTLLCLDPREAENIKRAMDAESR